MRETDNDISKLVLTDDQKIGIRIRNMRQQMKISQKRLGEALGVTFQQVQKYERGVNRVDPTKIVKMSNLFGVEPLYFFSKDVEVKLLKTDIEEEILDFIYSHDGIVLNESFHRIKSKALRKTILQLIRDVIEDQDK